jgi:peptidoglycan/LPS O-acetylase OafA/YrhL
MRKPWTHLSVYAIGIAAGLLVRARKKGSAGGPYGKTVTRLIGWGVSGAVMAAIIFAPNSWIQGILPDELFSGLYDGFHRIAWALAHTWVMYMIVADVEDGESSLAKTILGNKTAIAFGRLSLTAYVMHPVVQLLFMSTQQTHLFSGPVLLPYVIIGNLAMTYLFAFFVTMFCELPTSSLFCARDSTIVKKDDILKFEKPTTYAISSGRNGDIEMSKAKDASRL